MPGGGSSTLGTIRGTIKIDYDGKGILKAEDDVEKLGKKSESTKGSLDKLSKGLALGAAGIAGGFALATKVAVDFEKRLSAIKAVSGATTAEMEQLRAKALQLGADTKFSASESAQAMEELVKAGLSVQDVLGGAADATVALAAAGEIALPEAATIASNAMNQFALSAKELPHVADLIAGAANASAIDVGDFGHSLAQVGAVAHLTGQSIDDTATAIALLGNAGIKGSDAGTSLKTFLSNLVPTTDKARAAFHELGLDVGKSGNAFIDAKGNFKSLSDIAGILHKSITGLSEAQKQVALETIFGSDAIRAASVISEQGKKGFDELAASMNKMTAADVAATRMDNVAGKIEQLKGSAESLAITVGTELLPRLAKIVAALQKGVDWFAKLDKGTRDTIINIVGLTGALLGTLVVFYKIFKAIEAMRALVAVIKLWTIWSKVAAAATKAWAAVQWVLDAALAANPIGIVIIAIIALIAAIVILWKKSDKFREIVMAVWGAILTAVKAVVDWFKAYVLPTLTTIWQGIAKGFQWLMGVLSFVWQVIVQGVKTWAAIFQWAWGFIGPIVKAIFGLISSVVSLLWTIISAFFAVFKTVATAVFQAVWSVVSFFFNAWLATVKAVIGFVWPYIEKFLSWLVGYWSAVWNVVSSVVSTVWNFIVSIITSVVNWLKPYIAAAFNIVKSNIMTVWNAINAIIKGAVDRIVAVINGIKVIVDKIKTFFGQLKAAAEGGTGTLFAFVKSIPGKILDALGNVGSMLYNAGKKIIQGLINGITDMIGALKSQLSKITNMLPDWKGPARTDLRILEPAGEDVMQGFMNGVARMVPLLRNQLGGVTMGIAPAVASGASQTRPGTSTSTTTTYHQGTTFNGATFNVKTVWDGDDPASKRRFFDEFNTELQRFQGSRKR